MSDTEYSSDESSTADASYFVRLKDIKTLGELYQLGVLKAPPNLTASSTDASAASTGTGALETTTEGDASNDSQTTTKAAAYVPNPALLDRVSLYQGDITKLEVDAIVNAANKSLLGGGGVDGAIHAAAGPKLLAECRQLNGARTGESKITRGYDLPARHVIHTVGPVYAESEKEEKAKLLASCYKTSLEVAVENSLKHIAFPSVSTGIYGYPIEDATHIALKTTRDFYDSGEGEKLERIVFVVWSNKDKEVYEELLPKYFPPVQSA